MHDDFDLDLFEEHFTEMLNFSNMHMTEQYDACDDSMLKAIGDEQLP